MTSPERSSSRVWVGPGLTQCRECEAVVLVRDDGTLSSHYRYADGDCRTPNQPHDQIRCEGEQP